VSVMQILVVATAYFCAVRYGRNMK
jgi:hypothetical protein